MATTIHPTIRFSSDRERKNHEAGLELARRRLAGHHIETVAERSARTIHEGNAEIVSKFGAASALKHFGIKDSPTKKRLHVIADTAVVKVLAKVTSPVKPTASKAPLARKEFEGRPRVVKRLCSGGGLFGRSFA